MNIFSSDSQHAPFHFHYDKKREENDENVAIYTRIFFVMMLIKSLLYFPRSFAFSREFMLHALRRFWL